MSGHSKWSKIKRQKGATDAKKAKVFAKLAREIGIAVRAGGPAVVVAVANAARIFDTTSPSRSMMFSTAVNPASRFPR